MNMGSMNMDSMQMASTSMSMGASHTSSMSMASSTGMDSMSMDMDGMAGMHMYFTTQFKDYPVLFSSLKAHTKAQAFGIFLLFFFLAFLARGFEFLRMYLEQLVWKNPVYVECHPGDEHPAKDAITPKETGNCCGSENSEDSITKPNSAVFRSQSFESDKRNAAPNQLSLASTLYRDAIRLILCILPDLFGYALMLVAMTYTLTYFFSVVVGSGLGRFFFERLSDRLNIKASTSFARHC